MHCLLGLVHTVFGTNSTNCKIDEKKGTGSIIVEPLFCTEAKQEKLSSRRRVEGGLLWIQRTKTFVDQAGCPVQWLVVAQRSVRRAKVELCSCNGCGCPPREILLKMLPRHCAPVDLIKIYRATGANKLPGGQTAQLSVQILTAWVDDDGTIRRLIRQIWQPYHFAYIPILQSITLLRLLIKPVNNIDQQMNTSMTSHQFRISLVEKSECPICATGESS